MVDAVSLLCSCARLAHRPQPGVMRVLLGAAYRGLPSATPSQAVELARALGGLGVLPSADWMGRWDWRGRRDWMGQHPRGFGLTDSPWACVPLGF